MYQRRQTSAFFKMKDPVSNRQRNQLSFNPEFCTDIAHVQGVDNVVAEPLLRQFDDIAIIHTIDHWLADINLEQLAANQTEAELQSIAADTSLEIRKVFEELPLPSLGGLVLHSLLTILFMN